METDGDLTTQELAKKIRMEREDTKTQNAKKQASALARMPIEERILHLNVAEMKKLLSDNPKMHQYSSSQIQLLKKVSLQQCLLANKSFLLAVSDATTDFIEPVASMLTSTKRSGLAVDS